MDWWQRMVVLPAKRALVAVAARVRTRKAGNAFTGSGRGMLVKLRNEVQTCGYEDVQVMWEMLQRSAAELAGAPRGSKQKPAWSRRTSSSSARSVPRPLCHERRGSRS
ncbi:hypothetical protein C4D60_Mb10t07170 [Musa balbisiana]|uniref:Uncharacterized protein n=1 Tax=Musa balbisiana TaxID=52838 RepID=A0A4V4H4M4_MUSBA|nr:hypothetical protein C4D60_Mb10t07170 [Musa balbisiana]